MNIVTLFTWDGNYISAITIISQHNTEIKIKRSGKKLILKDLRVDYYRCIPLGDRIEVPIYEGCLEEDEPIIIEETQHDAIRTVNCDLCNKMMKEWGLIE